MVGHWEENEIAYREEKQQTSGLRTHDLPGIGGEKGGREGGKQKKNAKGFAV